MPAPPSGAPGLFRCAPPGYMRAVFAEAGFRDIAEEEVTCDLVVDTPERYWEFMTDIAAPVVAGLAKADELARERIRAEVLGLASQFLREGVVRMPSVATVVVGTR
jgi:hypothetical protein